jgi:hypothetical protein
MKPSDLISDAYKLVHSLKKELFVTVSESAKMQKLSRTFIHYLLKDGRVPGAYKTGKIWLIPEKWRYKKIRKGKKHGPKPRGMLSLSDPSLRVGMPSKTHPRKIERLY